MTVQPVANPAIEKCRTANHLLAQIARQDLPLSFTRAEEALVVSHCRKVERNLTKRLRRAAKAGGVRAGRREIYHYRTSLSVKVAHLWTTLPPNLRVRREDTCEEAEARRMIRWEKMARGVVALKDAQAVPKGRLLQIPKDDGRLREIIDYEWTDKARFRLLSAALTPFAGFHTSQYQLRWHPEGRGTLAACKALRVQLRRRARSAETKTGEPIVDGGLSNYSFVEMDVQNFFGSISQEWWATMPLLDGNIKRQLYTEFHAITVSIGEHVRLKHVLEQWVREGFPQGSALSALVAEWVMGTILRSLPEFEDVFLVVYCDNIGILAPTEKMDAIKKLIRETFDASRAGHFVLREKGSTRPASGPFTFLGYEFKVVDGEVEVCPPSVSLAWRQIDIRTELFHAEGEADFDRLEDRVKGSAASWSLWSKVDVWEAEMLRHIDEARDRFRNGSLAA